MRRRRAHLHFQVPAIGRLGHAQCAQAAHGDRAERRHVGETHAVGQPQQQPGEPAGDKLLRSQAAWLAAPARARAHHEICFAVRDRSHDGGQEIRHVAAVAV